MKALKKIKWAIRRQIVLSKYNHNFDKDKCIQLRTNDRCLGLTRLIVKDSINHHVPILVSNHITKQYIEQVICKNKKNSPIILVINEQLRGIGYNKFLIDNACTKHDIFRLKNIMPQAKIYNGFCRGGN